jgi:hypothetical protein
VSKTVIYCHKSKDVPKEKHYAIITFGSVTIPGDERSRTNPGHGYPEHTESTASYVAYTNKEEWEAEVKRLAAEERSWRDDFIALVVQPAKVSKSVSINVE